MEQWKDFLNKRARIIINDAPSPYPKFKDGIVKGFTTTHIILLQNNIEIALLLSDIRRIEIKGDSNDGN